MFYFLEKYDGLSDLVPYFTDQNENTFEKWGAHENEFWLFSNIKMNVTKSAEKVDEKNCISLSSSHVSFLTYDP